MAKFLTFNGFFSWICWIKWNEGAIGEKKKDDDVVK
jgi:hypothetical protein